MLLPSCTTSCALEPLYWTTLTLDSLAANWKEKHLQGDWVFCFGCACVFPPVEMSVSHPRWLITAEEEESHRGDTVSHSLFLFLGGFYFPQELSFQTARKVFFGNNTKTHATGATKLTVALSSTDLHLLVFGQSINDCDDKVFGQSKVGGADALGAVNNEGQVQRRTLALCSHTQSKRPHQQSPKRRRLVWFTSVSILGVILPQQAARSRLEEKGKRQKEEKMQLNGCTTLISSAAGQAKAFSTHVFWLLWGLELTAELHDDVQNFTFLRRMQRVRITERQRGKEITLRNFSAKPTAGLKVKINNDILL